MSFKAGLLGLPNDTLAIQVTGLGFEPSIVFFAFTGSTDDTPGAFIGGAWSDAIPMGMGWMFEVDGTIHNIASYGMIRHSDAGCMQSVSLSHCIVHTNQSTNVANWYRWSATSLDTDGFTITPGHANAAGTTYGVVYAAYGGGSFNCNFGTFTPPASTDTTQTVDITHGLGVAPTGLVFVNWFGDSGADAIDTAGTCPVEAGGRIFTTGWATDTTNMTATWIAGNFNHSMYSGYVGFDHSYGNHVEIESIGTDSVTLQWTDRGSNASRQSVWFAWQGGNLRMVSQDLYASSGNQTDTTEFAPDGVLQIEMSGARGSLNDSCGVGTCFSAWSDTSNQFGTLAFGNDSNGTAAAGRHQWKIVAGGYLSELYGPNHGDPASPSLVQQVLYDSKDSDNNMLYTPTNASAVATLRLYFAAAGTLYQQAVSGSQTFVGAVVRKTSKIATGAQTFTGGVSKAIRIRSGYNGAITFVGALAKKAIKPNLTGAITFAGGLVRKTKKVVSGALSFIGGLLYHRIIGKIIHMLIAPSKGINLVVSPEDDIKLDASPDKGIFLEE